METELDHVLLLQATPSPEVFLGVLAIILLLVCSGLISGSEIAFFSLTHHDFEKLQLEPTGSSQRILSLVERPRRLLATILISNNFINIAIVILSDFVLLQLLPQASFEAWGQATVRQLRLDAYMQAAQVGRAISFLVTVVGITALLVLFGEVAPKVYAKVHSIRLARIMSGPLLFLMGILNPLNHVLVGWTTLIEKRLNQRGKSLLSTSRKDIDNAIDLTVSQDENVASQEVDILKSIVKFGDVTVKQIMRSRVDVVSVDFRVSYKELLEIVRKSGFSRIPVHDNDFDNVTGILYVKDLLGHLHEAAGFEWQPLIRTNVLYVPEAKKISDLLKEFQREHLHMAIVVDEYGGSSGIVTLEDIMEEIIGEIKDEFDDEAEVIYRKVDDHNYFFEGKTLLNDVCRIIGVDIDVFDEVRGDADSLAGLLLEINGQLPKPDAEISFEGFRFKTVSVNKRRIVQVLVTLPEDY